MNSSIKFFVALISIALLSIGIFVFTKEDVSEPDIPANAINETAKNIQNDTQSEEKTFISLAEIATHNKEGDCWLTISGKVYNVSEITPTHPGGEAILQGCGIDATSLFETRPMGSGTPHSEKARNFLANLYIGELRN